MNPHEPAEFDRYAKDYGSLHAQSIRISGEDPDYFASYKVDEVVRLSERVRASGGDLVILDFGCGIGGAIPFFSTRLPRAHLHGADVSPESVALARERFSSNAQFVSFDGYRLPYEDDAFDVVFTSCVFHHIPPEQWAGSLREIRRVLKPDGELFIFEHNPWNPLTRKVVRDCPFDEHAVLLSAPTTRALIRDAGFGGAKVRYTVFFPRILSALRPLEKYLGSVPVGAQYFFQVRP